MKKQFILFFFPVFILFIILILLFSNLNFKKRENYSYSPEKAIEYSYKYIRERNPAFPNFESNCITFVSQCLVAGGLEMDGSKVNSLNKTKIVSTSNQWFCYSFDNAPYLPICYYVSSSFVKNADFISYWKKAADIYTELMDNTEENNTKLAKKINPGDILILYGDTVHAVLVTKVENGKIYYNSNSVDRYEYPLSNVDKKNYKKFLYMNFVE